MNERENSMNICIVCHKARSLVLLFNGFCKCKTCCIWCREFPDSNISLLTPKNNVHRIFCWHKSLWLPTFLKKQLLLLYTLLPKPATFECKLFWHTTSFSSNLHIVVLTVISGFNVWLSTLHPVFFQHATFWCFTVLTLTLSCSALSSLTAVSASRLSILLVFHVLWCHRQASSPHCYSLIVLPCAHADEWHAELPVRPGSWTTNWKGSVRAVQVYFGCSYAR